MIAVLDIFDHLGGISIRKLNEKIYREEYARQVLLHFYPEKYEGALLKDKPDIQIEMKDIGVEVTGSLLERIRYGLAQFIELRGKSFNSLSSKKKDLLREKEVFLNVDNEGIIEYIMPAAVWGTGNDTKTAYTKKLKALNKDGFQFFNENNLFLFAEYEEETEVQNLISFIEEYKYRKMKHFFDHVYIYTYKELYTISCKDLQYTSMPIDHSQRKLINDVARKAATVDGY